MKISIIIRNDGGRNGDDWGHLGIIVANSKIPKFLKYFKRMFDKDTEMKAFK